MNTNDLITELNEQMQYTSQTKKLSYTGADGVVHHYYHEYQKGATDNQIQILETHIGKQLPEIFIQILKLSNGIKFFLDANVKQYRMYRLSIDSCDTIMETYDWNMLNNMLMSSDEKENTLCIGRIVDSGTLVLDLREDYIKSNKFLLLQSIDEEFKHVNLVNWMLDFLATCGENIA